MNDKLLPVEWIVEAKPENDVQEGDSWSLFLAGDYAPAPGKVAGTEGDPSMEMFSDRLIDRIKKADVAVVNLEAPLRADGFDLDKSGPRLNTVESALEYINNTGFSVAGMANNHMMDYGFEGVIKTQEICRKLGLKFCGAGENISEALRPAVVEVGSMGIGIISLCEREFGVASESSPGTAWIYHPMVEEVIKKTKQKVDVLIVMAHGGLERTPFPPGNLKAQLRKFIQTGADVVVGHHPHVPQGWERFEGGYIFYSLGDFFLDYPRRKCYPKSDWGITVTIDFVHDKIKKIKVLPIVRANEKLDLMSEGSSRVLEWKNHLFRLSEIASDASLSSRCWEALSEHFFEKKIEKYLSAIFFCPIHEKRSRRILWNFKNFGKELIRMVLYGNGKIRSMDDLMMLNLIRNESTWNVMVTALEGRLKESGRDNSEVKKELIKILEWTDL